MYLKARNELGLSTEPVTISLNPTRYSGKVSAIACRVEAISGNMVRSTYT